MFEKLVDEICVMLADTTESHQNGAAGNRSGVRLEENTAEQEAGGCSC